MLRIEKYTTPSPEQWEITIEGARNAMNSWDQMDSDYCYDCYDDIHKCRARGYVLGPNDHDLLMRLSKAGTDESKYRRMLPVHLTLTAPLYWWKEFETYRVGVYPCPTEIEMNSCSTMHKLTAKEFEIFDFSFGKLIGKSDFCWENGIMAGEECRSTPLDVLETTIYALNVYRDKFLETKDKQYWWQMIQLLPSSYNQKRTLSLNYEALANMYHARRHHKLDEWHVFCDWIKTLPYSKLITGETK